MVSGQKTTTMKGGGDCSGDRGAVHVIIVNFNAGDAVIRCVASALAAHEQASIQVLDNASSDGSAERLDLVYGENPRIVLHRQPDNAGFAPMVNAAAASNTAEFLLILNPDCEVHSGSIGLLLQALKDDHKAALAAPCVLDQGGAVQRGTLRRFPDPWKSLMTVSGLWRWGRKFPRLRGIEGLEHGVPLENTAAEAVSGACMLVRREEFLRIGGLDEGYALHCEDLDLMYRLRQQGLHCLLVPAARATHLKGVSSRSRPFWVHWQKHRSMQRFFLKFQAGQHTLPMRWLVSSGIWLRYLLGLPLLIFRR
jgi:GT2 family glycosyltransferase